MSDLIFILVIVNGLIAISFVGVTGYIDRKNDSPQSLECAAWQNITNTMEAAPNVRAACANNQECTGVTCDGVYNMPFIDSVKFCFGIVVEPCSAPNITVLLFVELFNLPGNETTNLTFTSSELKPIKGAKFEIPSMGSTQALIQTEMNKKSNTSFFLAVKLRFRVTFGSTHQMFLPMSVTLIPGHVIPIPPCDKSPNHYVHKNGSCRWDATLLPTTTTTMAPPTAPPLPARNGTSRGNCDPDSMYHCPDGYICNAHGECECPEHIPEGLKMGICLANPPPPEPHSNKDAVVIGSSLTVVVLVVAVIIIVSVIVYRRYRRRYGQHEVLLNNEDDPVEIPT